MSTKNLDHAILEVLPSASASATPLSTSEVYAKFSRLNTEKSVSLRTILRALERLLEAQLIDSEMRGVSLYWKKRPGASGIRHGAMMSHDEALALQTLRRFSGRQIPTLVTEALFPLFSMAEERLNKIQSSHEGRYRKWADKVEVEHNGFSLIYPEIDPLIFSETSQALFLERKLEVIYHPRTSTEAQDTRVILPLGLVEVSGLIYLIAGVKQHSAPAMYRLDRISQARMLDESFTYPKSFRLKEYTTQQRQFDFRVEGPIRLKLRFSNGSGDHLLETPLSSDQNAKRIGQFLEIQGTVQLSQKLRWWVRAFGPNVEVIKPAKLRAEFEREASELVARYSKSTQPVSR